VIFAVLITSIIGTQDAFAVTKTYTGPQDGDWFVPGSWSPFGVPAPNDDVLIPGPTEPDINSDVLVGPGGSLTLSGGASQDLDINAGTLTNRGGTVIAENDEDIDVNDGATFFNDCGGTVLIGPGNAQFRANSGGTIINLGSITSIGDGTMDLNSGSLFQDGGITLVTFDDTDGTIEQIENTCIVGGSLLPIDTTALLLASAQSISMWMIPVVISAVGIGLVLVRKI